MISFATRASAAAFERLLYLAGRLVDNTKLRYTELRTSITTFAPCQFVLDLLSDFRHDATLTVHSQCPLSRLSHTRSWLTVLYERLLNCGRCNQKFRYVLYPRSPPGAISKDLMQHTKFLTNVRKFAKAVENAGFSLQDAASSPRYLD